MTNVESICRAAFATVIGMVDQRIVVIGTIAVALVGGPIATTARGDAATQQRASRPSGLHEGFEGTVFPPPGWRVKGVGGPPSGSILNRLMDEKAARTWHRSTDPHYVPVGAGAALIEGMSTVRIDEWLISPMFFVSAADSTLRFRWLGNPRFASNVMGTCAVRRKGESTWAIVWRLSQENSGLVFHYPERAVEIGAWVGDSVQVAFRAAGINGADFGVDEIETGLFPVTTAPSNDRCAAATRLPAGSFSLTGNTCYAANDMDPSTAKGTACISEDASGADLFYAVDVQAGDTLWVRLPVKPAAYTHLYIMDSCDSSATCLAGKDAHGGEGDEDTILTHVFTASGRYYLVVDTMSGSCGDFSLTGALRARRRPRD